VRRSFVLLVAASGLTILSCGPAVPTAAPTAPPFRAEVRPRIPTPAPGIASGDPATGQRLFVEAGCGGCHTLHGLPGAIGISGPNLTNVGLRPTLAGEAVANTPQSMVAWLLDPPAVKPGATMPRVGLTERQAQDVAAFLFSQPYTAWNR
jgi:cytochrome c1